MATASPPEPLPFRPPDPTRVSFLSAADEQSSTTPSPECPSCGEPWLRGTNLPGRYRCLYCLHRFELRSECPHCGAHSTIARMSDTANVICRNCGGSMLQPI
jgi:SprT-like zinc ribbon domain